MAKKALGEEQGSPFTQRITDAPPPRKLCPFKFNVYNVRSDPIDHVHNYKQVMTYWISDDPVMSHMFPASLGNSKLRSLPRGQIYTFRKLTEKFTTRFITNSRVVKGPYALTHLKKEKNETARDYSSRYWEVFQEAKDSDMKFVISIFKYRLPWDKDGIYND